MSAPASSEQIVALLETAPGWCRVGLTAPSAQLRTQAVRELAAYIATGLVPSAEGAPDSRQLALPIAGAAKSAAPA